MALKYQANPEKTAKNLRGYFLLTRDTAPLSRKQSGTAENVTFINVPNALTEPYRRPTCRLPTSV